MYPLHQSPTPSLSGISAFPPPCNLWVLYGTIGLLMGGGYPENPGEVEHVPQGQLHWVLAGGRWCGDGFRGVGI